MSKEADVVAIVVSALAPVTRTLAEFLPVTVTHRARRTAVVSHVDLIEARDRNLVLRSVRRRLDLAGMDDAPVFPAAAVVASGGRSLTDLAAGPGTAPRRVEEAVARRALRWAVDLDRRLGCRPSARQVSGVLAELRQLNTLARAWTADELDRYDADLPAVTSLLHRLASGAEPPPHSMSGSLSLPHRGRL